MTRHLTQGLPVGLPLIEALLQDMTPAARKRLQEYGERATEWMDFLPGDDDGSWYFRSRYERAFEKKLESGDLIGTGILKPLDARRPRRVISPELWSFGFKNYEQSSLILDKQEFVEIEVFPASEFVEKNKQKTIEGFSSGTVAANAIGADITFSGSGVLKIGPDTLIFNGPKQRKLIEVLIENYKANNPCKVSALLEQAGFSFNVDTLGKAFGKNKSWPKLVRYLKRDNGHVLLQPTP